MALDDDRARVGPDGASAEQAASKVGAMVADRVRTALASAERAAADVRRRALDRASADREALHGTAALVTARIDLIEAEVGHLLQELRDEVALIVAEADRAADAAALHDADAEPDHVAASAGDEPAEPDVAVEAPDEHVPAAAPRAGTSHAAPSHETTGRRRGRLFRRLAPARACGVCGRAPSAEDPELEGWHQASGTSLCPECQAAGWQLPERGKVPYRSAQSAAGS
jgi:hypothetical protein